MSTPDRGWIPWGSTRDAVPAVPTPSGRVNLSGLLKLPNEDFYTLEKTKPEPGQAVWQHLDMAHYRNLHAFDLQPMILIMSPQSAGGGFERELPTYTDEWVARHRGYALQWFGLAAVLVIVSLALFLRHYRSTSTREVAE